MHGGPCSRLRVLLTIIRVRVSMRAMYICLCNAVTTSDIRRAASEGVCGFAELQARTGCSDCCGSCEGEARQVLAQAVHEIRLQVSVGGIPA